MKARASNVGVRPLLASDWEQLSLLVRREWAPDHPILDFDLFRWQYEGFGPLRGLETSRVIEVEGQVRGFRGVIPGVYQVSRPGEPLLTLPGGSFAMWIVASDLRGQGLGRLLFDELDEVLPVRVALGSNEKTAVPHYRRAGFQRLDGLHRWFRALDPEGFLALSFGPWDLGEVGAWVDAAPRSSAAQPCDMEGSELERHWIASTASVGLFGLHRISDFWEWRYLGHPSFEYLFFGEPVTQGVIVGRIERCRTDEADPAEGLPTLRIIEMLPRDSATWMGRTDPGFDALLAGVLSWARDHGCVAADFRCSNRRLSSSLRAAGFIEEPFELPTNNWRGMAGLLRPLRREPRPINAHWKIRGQVAETRPDPGDTYLVKSDNDMDRPNDPNR